MFFFYSLENELRDWLLEIAEKQAIPKNIVAVYFGVYEGVNGFNISISGSKFYDKTDNDWVFEEDFKPSETHFYVTNKKINNLLCKEFVELAKDKIDKIIKKDKKLNAYFYNLDHIAIGYEGCGLMFIR